MILTDPPYNLSVKNNFRTMKGRQGIDFGEWDKGFDQTAWIPSVLSKLKSGGNIIIFNAWRNLGAISSTLEDNGCLIKEMIVWKKTNPMPRNRDRLYVTSYEVAVWAAKGKSWAFNRQKPTYENGFFEYPTCSHSERIHPTQKPLNLFRDLINIHSKEGDVVLDPFMGSGTTAIACMLTGRRFIGFELDSNYYSKAIDRITNYKNRYGA